MEQSTRKSESEDNNEKDDVWLGKRSLIFELKGRSPWSFS